MVESTREIGDKIERETRFYITSLVWLAYQWREIVSVSRHADRRASRRQAAREKPFPDFLRRIPGRPSPLCGRRIGDRSSRLNSKGSLFILGIVGTRLLTVPEPGS